MKILVISQHYYPENFRITDICETLVKQGNEVTVICGYPNYPEGFIKKEYRGSGKKKHRNEMINGVSVYRCSEIPRGHNKLKLFLNYYSVCLSMKKKARGLKERYDLVFINQTSPVMVGWAGIEYSRKHHIPCILYCYDLWPESLAAGGIKNNSPIMKHYFKISNRIYKRVDCICCTSKLFINYFLDIHHIDQSKLFYLPQYCEELFVNEARAQHNGINYVFAGNIGNVQSVETIVKAANEIKIRKDITIHVVGDGSSLNRCKRMADDFGLRNIIFHGKKPLEEMPYFYKIADAMLLTLSTNEVISRTLPGKTQSYMSSGKPIIAAVDGETARVIKESNCGLLCSSENYRELAKLMATYRKDEYDYYSNNSYKYYTNHFRKDLFFAKLNELFSKYINNCGAQKR